MLPQDLAVLPGSLYLFDHNEEKGFHQLSNEYQTDWKIFFDMCRENPTPYTEQIIKAIIQGLRPTKSQFFQNLTKKGRYNFGGGTYGKDWVYKPCWIVFIEKTINSQGIPNFSNYPVSIWTNNNYIWSYPVSTWANNNYIWNKTIKGEITSSRYSWILPRTATRKNVMVCDSLFTAWSLILEKISY